MLPSLRTRVASGLILALASGAACDGTAELETRTFELAHLGGEQAAAAVEPYVYTDRPEAPGRISVFRGGITVRETPDNLDRIARALERLDRERPAVRLRFQVIEADGSRERDPRIADVEAALRELFRFEGYELLAETQMGAVEGGTSTQAVQGYMIRGEVREVRTAGARGAVEVHVILFAPELGELIRTSMTVPVDETVVLGSAQVDPDRPAIILTVRPELVGAAQEDDEEERRQGQ